MTKMLTGHMKDIEARTKSSVTEINTFLHEVHVDFESFVRKHKKEHASLNERVLKVAEASETVVNTVLATKAAVD